MPDERTVHIIEDDPAVRESLALLLKGDSLPVRLYASAPEFLEKNPEPKGCVVSDIVMPGMTGLELLEEMKSRRVLLPTILMTAYADVPQAVKAMKLGAVDFIEKPFDDELIVSLVRSALARRGDWRVGDAEALAAREKLGGLSVRERDVLAGLLKGKLNKTIAFELGISVRTVETHRANLMAKAEVASLSELVRMSLLAESAPAAS
ncbi:response regulator [uncultured Rhodoblastus sp.]|uniref:response regulator transcription factor n=1 Tax=uncultured Rhodoblastus sp. TaxID=543037 RepID=UPI0025DF1B14|nr:response regulator [uncultured Rhodoblastus sp.]